MNRKLTLSAVLSLALSVAAPVCHADSFKNLLLRITDFGSPARDSLVTADFTGDGNDEIFMISNNTAVLLIALAQDVNGFSPVQHFRLPIQNGSRSELHVVQDNSEPRLVLVTTQGTNPVTSEVRVYSGWPLRQQLVYSIAPGHFASAVGDLNNDGVVELVVNTLGETYGLRLNDGQWLWSVPTDIATDIVLANLDSDPALEMVLAGYPPGKVYDGSSHELEWSWQDGFGRYLAAGNIGTDGTPAFVGALDWTYFTVFGGVPWSPSWNFQRFDIDAVLVANVDGSGADEIIQGDGQWGSINIIDSQNHSLRRSIPNPGHGTAALAVAKTQSSSGKDVVFAPARASQQNATVLRMARSSDGEILRDLISDAGGIGATTIGDLDGDGAADLVVANSTASQGRIHVIDRDTGREKWLSPSGVGNANDPFYIQPRFLFQTQLDNDAPLELVVAGNGGGDGRIIVLDGQTKEIQLQIGDYSNSRPIPSRGVAGAVLLDYDTDGFKDIALITQPTSTGESGVRVHVLSLRTGQMLWESDRLGQGFATARGIFVQPGSSQKLLVAVLPEGLYAFGVESQLLEWMHSIPCKRAIYAGLAPAGPEIVVEDNIGLVTHLDASTLTTRRSYPLREPSRGILPQQDAPYLLFAESDGLSLRTMEGVLLGKAKDAIAQNGPSAVSVTWNGSTFDVLTGLDFGYVLHTLNTNSIFANSFESK